MCAAVNYQPYHDVELSNNGNVISGGNFDLAQQYARDAQAAADNATAAYRQGAGQYVGESQFGGGQYGDGQYGGGGDGGKDFDEESEDTTRGEAWSDFLSCVSSPLLRVGFLLQLLVLIFGFALHYGNGGRGVFSFDLFSTPEKLRRCDGYTCSLILLDTVYLMATLCISSFQVFVCDDSKSTRGYRAGSKLLSTAAITDTVVVALRLMQAVYAHEFLAERWWMKYQETSVDWCIFYASGLLHSIALLMYGLAGFYMESYHDEGTYEEWSWIMLGLFAGAGFFEATLVLTGFGAFYTLVHVVALLAAVIWAFSFEPLLHYHAAPLHDRNVEADIPLNDEEDDDAAEPSAGVH